MAGYVIDPDAGQIYDHVALADFHIDTPEVVSHIRTANGNRRVIMVQLDGDELDALLWGLENYSKVKSGLVELKKVQMHEIEIHFFHATCVCGWRANTNGFTELAEIHAKYNRPSSIKDNRL